MTTPPRPDQQYVPVAPATVSPGGTRVFRKVIIIGSGGLVLVYSPTAGAGNLIASVAGAAGTDPYGNAYLAGITSYAGSSSAEMSGGRLVVTSATVAPTKPNVQLHNAASGDLAFAIDVTGDPAARLRITSDGHIGWGAGNAALDTFLLRAAAAALLEQSKASGLSGSVPAVQSDLTTYTVTAASATQASAAWSIPANDAVAGGLYRLTVWGFGTEGTTAQKLTFGMGINGTQVRSVTPAALTVSGAFRWYAVLLLSIVTTGAGGTASVALDGNWATTANPTVSGSFTGGSPSQGDQSVDTTSANTFGLLLGWGSATGAPTITSIGSSFERIV